MMAQKAQARMQHPSKKVYQREVSHKSSNSLFGSCQDTTKDISNAHTIIGPSLPFTIGKWVQSRSMRVEPGYVFILPNLLSDCNIVFAMHVMFVCSTILS